MMPVDPQKQVDYPEAPWGSNDAMEWFGWMYDNPSPLDAVNCAYVAGMDRDLIAFAFGYIGQDIRHDRMAQEADRRAQEKAVWREHEAEITGEVPF